ncbi:unnamed protein product [Prorocentrum cordatum]|uniref:Uncharacterized protein n=1 Tax=Prorocentrum cordatum TaxID=2364126 RepID=A0ABN9TQB2_9DINO|nr:unnamed protein product [Polarella glacialis]
MDLAVSLAEPPPCERPAPDDAAGCFSARSGAAAPEAAAVRALCEQEPDLDGFERLDKWRHCEEEGVGECRVFAHNLARARNSGFPSTLECGEAAGLSPHEIAALFGWTTGDFRFLNPIARGLAEVTFQDYPRGAAVLCRLSREEVLPYVQVVSAALRKLPPAAGGQVLWRGHRRPVAAEVGAVLELPGFASASHDRTRPWLSRRRRTQAGLPAAACWPSRATSAAAASPGTAPGSARRRSSSRWARASRSWRLGQAPRPTRRPSPPRRGAWRRRCPGPTSGSST